MLNCREKLFYTVIIDISMVVENAKILGSPRNRSTNSTSTDYGKSLLYLLLGICIGIAYSSLVSLATVIRV